MNLFITLIMAVLTATTLKVSSPAFNHKGNIPAIYTCEGKGINPPVNVENIPDGTKSLVLIVDDPDAAGRTFDHWVTWNIVPGKTIAENSIPGMEGKNGSGQSGYKGPCPPMGTHHYFFKVYALDILLDLPAGADKQTVEIAMEKHVLARGELIGLYKKTNP